MVFKPNTIHTYNQSHNQQVDVTDHRQPPPNNSQPASPQLSLAMTQPLEAAQKLRLHMTQLLEATEEAIKKLGLAMTQLQEATKKLSLAMTQGEEAEETVRLATTQVEEAVETLRLAAQLLKEAIETQTTFYTEQLSSTAAANVHGKPYLMMKKKSLLEDNHHQHDEKNTKMVCQSSNCFCGICFDFKPASDMFTRSKCNHPFCTDCISKHVAAKIQQNVINVKCPNLNCGVELQPEYLQPVLPKEVIDRWESAKYESLIALWQKTYCPFEDCSVLLVDDGNRGHAVTSSECPSCHRLFCAQCKVPWHAEMNCKEFQEMKRREGEKDLDRQFLELAKREMWQTCPNCSIYVQKHSGCEHMTCRCGCNFCYQCGENWSFGHVCKIRRT